MDHYAVFGNPVKHSRSPWIHAQFAAQTGAELEYRAQEVDPAQFEQQVLAFFASGGAGLNITVPFKERAHDLAQVLSEAATVAGAVNTLYQGADGRLVGDNTDGVGMLRDILQNKGVLRQRRILVVGAGGAVRGVLPNLLAERPAELVIVNRTAERASALAARFRDLGPVRGGGFELLSDAAGMLPFDWVINGTSAGLGGGLPPLPDNVISPRSWGYDMVYGQGQTVFQQWCRNHGAEKALDGLGMLVEQAAEAFYLWRGVRPQTAPVIATLRQKLAEG